MCNGPTRIWNHDCYLSDALAKQELSPILTSKNLVTSLFSISRSSYAVHSHVMYGVYTVSCYLSEYARYYAISQNNTRFVPLSCMLWYYCRTLYLAVPCIHNPAFLHHLQTSCAANHCIPFAIRKMTMFRHVFLSHHGGAKCGVIEVEGMCRCFNSDPSDTKLGYCKQLLPEKSRPFWRQFHCISNRNNEPTKKHETGSWAICRWDAFHHHSDPGGVLAFVGTTFDEATVGFQWLGGHCSFGKHLAFSDRHMKWEYLRMYRLAILDLQRRLMSVSTITMKRYNQSGVVPLQERWLNMFVRIRLHCWHGKASGWSRESGAWYCRNPQGGRWFWIWIYCHFFDHR